MSIRPLDDRVLIKPLDAEEKTAGGILLPENAKEKPQKGKIIALGNGRVLEDGSRAKFSVKKGDVVLFGKYAGTEIKIGGTEHSIMRETDILGVFE